MALSGQGDIPVKQLLFSMTLMLNVSAVSALSLNEIRIDQPGGDNDEYIELSGDAFESLADHTYLVIGDGNGGSGTIEAVIDLSAEQLDSAGLFTVAEAGFSLVTANLTTTLNLENNDNVTHLLVTNFSGADGDDLDIDNDGVLDVSPWSSVIDSVSLKKNDSGDKLYSSTVVGPSGTFVPSHVYRCAEGWRIGNFDLGVNDSPGQLNDCDDGSSGPVARTIPEIQSAGMVSPFVGEMVKVTGVVTADFQADDQLRGFYLQDQIGDADPTTSDGIFVFDPQGTDVQVGDVITLTAVVDEFLGLTELKNVSSLTIIGTGSIAPTLVNLPETVDGELEQYEGMLVEIAPTMTVSQNFFLGRYGQMTLAAPDDNGISGRLFQPTNQFQADSPEAIALAQSNARRILVLDDGQDISRFGDNPDPVPYIGLPPQIIRAGDTVTELVGVLDYGRINSASTPARDYRLHPTQVPVFTTKNHRVNQPEELPGRISIASFNVLNYFTTLDGQGAICWRQANQGCRGADSASELQRQQDKIVAAIQAMDADIIGLVELENNGYGADSAIQTLTDAVNAAIGSNVYRVAGTNDALLLGNDVIGMGYIYKSSIVQPIGIAATLDSGAFDQNQIDGGISRQPLAISFEELGSGEQFTAVINHFKSKRPPSSVLNNANDDQGDGQGAWNLRRTEAAGELASWLASNPTGIDDPDILIIGDLNAYALEDPIEALKNAGYSDLIFNFNGQTSYSFIFDGQSGYLDHALANQALKDQVAGVSEWHINTDEPKVIDYDENFNPQGYYSADPFRSSDHDPVIVSLNLHSINEPLDEDEDGVEDEFDKCPATKTNLKVDETGCSGKQNIAQKCNAFFPDKPSRYIHCVYRTASMAYHQGLLNKRQAWKAYRKAVRKVIRFYRW